MREYGKEDIYKPKRTNNTAIYGNLLQSTAICGNLRQSTRTYNTTCYYYDQYRNSKEGREDKCVYRYSNCIVIGY